MTRPPRHLVRRIPTLLLDPLGHVLRDARRGRQA